MGRLLKSHGGLAVAQINHAGRQIGGARHAVSVARAMIADPHLHRHLREPGPAAPVCGYCNGCIARGGGAPIDCYSDEIRARRDQMLATPTHKPITTTRS